MARRYLAGRNVRGSAGRLQRTFSGLPDAAQWICLKGRGLSRILISACSWPATGEIGLQLYIDREMRLSACLREILKEKKKEIIVKKKYKADDIGRGSSLPHSRRDWLSRPAEDHCYWSDAVTVLIAIKCSIFFQGNVLLCRPDYNILNAAKSLIVTKVFVIRGLKRTRILHVRQIANRSGK